MRAEAVRLRVEQHVAAVGAVDIDGLRRLYARDATLYDSAGSTAVVGRDAIGDHFSRWLTEGRAISSTRIVIMGHDNSLAVLTFTATPEGGRPVDIVDVMRFTRDLLITEMSAFAVPGGATAT